MQAKQEKSKFAIVTGSSRGIGKAIARQLLECGIDVVLTGRSRATLEKASKEFRGLAGKPYSVVLDLSDPGDISRFVRDLPDEIDRCDILVNCAGIYKGESFTHSTVEDLDALYETNVRGCYALTRELIPHLRDARGDVVVVNSSIVNSPSPSAAMYAATKHALTGLANSLRAEVNPLGIRVLSVYPGRTATPMQRLICEESSIPYQREQLLQPEDIAQIIVACIQLPDTAEVTELHIRPRQKVL